MSTSKPTLVQPYLMFGGRCDEALEFYRTAIGAEVELIMRYKDAPEQPPAGMLAAGYENKVMHCSFRVGANVLMASDGCGGPDEGKFDGFSLSITVRTEEDADRKFAALAEGGTVTMPLGETFWSPKFGMCTDRFGLGWMINLEP